MWRTQQRISPDPESVRNARGFVTSALDAWGVEGDGVVLMADELVTNAVRHARTDVTLVMLRQGRRVRVEVHDDDPELPVMRSPSADDTNGRGMIVVAEEAEAWGVDEHSQDGKAVWFEVAAKSRP
jgi:anti-sigma regulatory factor (Ser/Thr protein kinase)